MTTPLNTIDEPVSTTIARDVKRIGFRLAQVLLPRSGIKNEERYHCLRDWDLWFPLLVGFILSSVLQMSQKQRGDGEAFALVFGIVSLGAFVVSVNTTLLGGNASLFQSVCLLCYCLGPLAAVSLISAMVLQNFATVRLILCAIAVAWGIWASLGFFSGLVPAKRKLLAIYPVFLFFISLGMMVWASLLQVKKV
ncbi:hypothetical protein RCL1_008300 [Eukaryota sp. TZLM3-RCL]